MPARTAGRWFTLAEDMTITGCYADAKAGLALAVGQTLTEAFPNVPDELTECYRAAFRTGSAACLAEYPEGTLLSVYAIRRGDEIHVSFDSIRPADLKRLLLRWEARACAGCEAPRQAAPSARRSRPTHLTLVA